MRYTRNKRNRILMWIATVVAIAMRTGTNSETINPNSNRRIVPPPANFQGKFDETHVQETIGDFK